MTYGTMLIVSILVCFLYDLLRVKRAALPVKTCLISLPLILLCAIVLSRLTYVLCFLDLEMFDEYWVEDVLLSKKITEFSVFGGAVGACLGVYLAARLTHARSLPYLDAFAPAGALLLCGIRIAEIHQGRLGAGMYIPEGSPQARFPLANTNDWGEAFLSVFLLEAAVALLVAILFSVLPGLKAGRCFTYTVLYLALPQIFFESLRAISMRWGFVHIEQLFCGLLVLLMVFLGCRKVHMAFTPRFLPVLGVIGCIGIIVFVEFALDKFAIPDLLCYGIMILALSGMAVLEHYTLHRLDRAE
ncbi:MAG: prolipoprotein diacylglyceryl transferase [Clostridia bacterium]|nr:prolipoprotein diacylglyceryl transferase [Clostridia bacterium]